MINFKKEEYKQAVDEMIRYIIEGDIYITNMTQQLEVKSNKKPLDVFYDLRENNPSPFGGYMDYGDFQIVCASPERFLKMKKGHVNTRPIDPVVNAGDVLLELAAKKPADERHKCLKSSKIQSDNNGLFFVKFSHSEALTD